MHAVSFFRTTKRIYIYILHTFYQNIIQKDPDLILLLAFRRLLLLVLLVLLLVLLLGLLGRFGRPRRRGWRVAAPRAASAFLEQEAEHVEQE